MPGKKTLTAIAKRKKITVRELCQQALDKYGTEFLAAQHLGVYPNAIRYHLGKTQPAQAGK